MYYYSLPWGDVTNLGTGELSASWTSWLDLLVQKIAKPDLKKLFRVYHRPLKARKRNARQRVEIRRST